MELLFPLAQHTSLEDATNPYDTDPPICGDQLKTLTVPFSEVHPSSEQNLQMNWAVFQEISDLLKLIGSENDGTSADISTVSRKAKEELLSNIEFLTVAITLPAVKKPCGDAGDDVIQEVHSMLEELKQLHSMLETRNSKVESTERLLKSLMLRKPKLEALLNQCIVPMVDSDIVTPEKHCEEKGDSVCGKVEKIELSSTTRDSESVAPAEHCEGKDDAAFGEVKEMQLPSAATKSESSNQGGQSKQMKGKGKSKKPRR